MENIIEVENLSVFFEKVGVVEDVSFSLSKGDFLMILGPNGAGKSVLLRSLLGVVDYSGSVKIFGKSVDEVRGRIGYVPQHIDFDRNFPLTVEEVVRMGLIGLKKNRDKSIGEILELVGLNDKTKSFFGQLSGGQMRRALIARALIRMPEILFLDEPLAGVDVVGEKNFYEMIADWHLRFGLTTVMVSHDFDLVSKIATKILCINKRRMCFGDPMELTTKNFEKTFGKGVSLHNH